MKLTDSIIRESFISRLNKQKQSPEFIFQEIAVCRGLAVADIIAAFKVPHCFEIKSDVDTLNRLESQIPYFCNAFPKISIITTNKHLDATLDLVPEWWGVIKAALRKNEVNFIYTRASKRNPQNTKANILETIWNKELVQELQKSEICFNKSLSRKELSSLLAKNIRDIDAYEIFNKFQNNKLKNKVR